MSTSQRAHPSERQHGQIGNVRKFQSYSAAWKRIKAARNAGFFLEAIVIEESIISDRLISFLARPSAVKPLSKSKNNNWPQFGELIGKLRASFPEGLRVGAIENLPDALDAWRHARNDAVHAIVKSDPGTPTVDVDDFLSKAMRAAATGEELARVVENWHRSSKRRDLRDAGKLSSERS